MDRGKDRHRQRDRDRQRDSDRERIKATDTGRQITDLSLTFKARSTAIVIGGKRRGLSTAQNRKSLAVLNNTNRIKELRAITYTYEEPCSVEQYEQNKRTSCYHLHT